MKNGKIMGWIMIVAGAWWLISGIAMNDMGGIAGLGYNPDAPMSFALAPGRFLLGIVINGLIVYAGIRTILQAKQTDG
ncbi:MULTISPECIES: hypothetical protein [unclassified Shinella]|jgi:hypothetical protein|uniref:hypothetical protein n=1 Tax=unclassified Shinella TaxID=2643062 RepID=UPI00234F54E4|nr:MULTISPECIES: hypothetical protein [unclassified Shinella]MCO5151162.1 hypothetical protein [Shinella sp.]MDC7266011.1 hypothetical protein [Shinella sp. HY16]MDC7272908.1 hypothetical protein [Shinella sp. YZ44]